jgi:hypothetical protein
MPAVQVVEFVNQALQLDSNNSQALSLLGACQSPLRAQQTALGVRVVLSAAGGRRRLALQHSACGAGGDAALHAPHPSTLD